MAQSNVRITMVNPETHEVTLTNMGTVAQNISTHYLCLFPDYKQVSSMEVLAGNTNLMAGASVTLVWPDGHGPDGECGYYINNLNFGTAANMRDYMEWGSAGHFRESLAVTAGYWNAGDFVDGDPAFTFTGTGADHGSAFWSSEVAGCTYPLACNYNASATKEDGSCDFASCQGCTIACAPNYDPLATIDDGSCLNVACSSGCQEDLDGNGVVNTADLLTFMAAFGNICN